MRVVTTDNLIEFLKAHAVAVVHIDAVWDVGCIEVAREKMRRVEAEFGDRVSFGEVDSDTQADYCRALRVANVPTLAYYRDNKLVDLIVGPGQDIGAAVRLLLTHTDVTGKKLTRAAYNRA